ncbi:MAG: PIN domain-containing protein [Chloroflexota bacterium]|nr:PIN domain-containing protein [Chloroflexota bacterium]
MTFVDTNYFLRGLVRPETPRDEVMAREAAALFRRAERGEEEITTSDAVLAEVAFVLSSPRQYNRPPDDIAARLKPILELRGFRLPQKRVVLRALDIWAASPRLGFVDALTASYAQEPGATLATFDSDFDDLPGITRYRP